MVEEFPRRTSAGVLHVTHTDCLHVVAAQCVHKRWLAALFEE